MSDLPWHEQAPPPARHSGAIVLLVGIVLAVMGIYFPLSHGVSAQWWHIFLTALATPYLILGAIGLIGGNKTIGRFGHSARRPTKENAIYWWSLFIGGGLASWAFWAQYGP